MMQKDILLKIINKCIYRVFIFVLKKIELLSNSVQNEEAAKDEFW